MWHTSVPHNMKMSQVLCGTLCPTSLRSFGERCNGEKVSLHLGKVNVDNGVCCLFVNVCMCACSFVTLCEDSKQIENLNIISWSVAVATGNMSV